MIIPIEKLREVTHVVSHKSCPDGVASALILRDALPDVRVSFMSYGTKELASLPAEPGMLFCDFSPPKERSQEFVEVGTICLDHHSRDVVEPYGELGVFGDNAKLECGAMLAYREVWQRLLPQDQYAVQIREPKVRELARLAAIRDTWKRDDPDFEKACRQASVCMFYRFEQLSILGVLGNHGELLATRLFERQIELAETCIKEALHFMSEQGTRVLMFQGVSATSDAAELLTEMADEMGATDEPSLIVGFHYRTDAGKLQLQFSTRSHTGFDCRAFAQAHGGNGHPEAAGFTLTTGQKYGSPYDVFQDLLNDYEAKL